MKPSVPRAFRSRADPGLQVPVPVTGSGTRSAMASGTCSGTRFRRLSGTTRCAIANVPEALVATSPGAMSRSTGVDSALRRRRSACQCSSRQPIAVLGLPAGAPSLASGAGECGLGPRTSRCSPQGDLRIDPICEYSGAGVMGFEWIGTNPVTGMAQWAPWTETLCCARAAGQPRLAARRDMRKAAARAPTRATMTFVSKPSS
jgi:hypothetical protein